jgi:hypothetical protein
MKALIIILLLMPSIAICQKQHKDWIKIQEVLKNQTDAWNTGNIENYMTGYWNSPNLKFIGKNGITYGYQQTLDNYKKAYPTQEKMGILTFNLLSNEKVGKKHFIVIGQWKLTRKSDVLEGHFTLLWKKINGKWVITNDHSS